MASLAVMLVCAALALASSSAAAQDMQFGLPPADATAPAAPASELLARALRHYDAERFEPASVLLQQVIEGATGDSASGAQLAQFYLAKALLHQGYLHSALALFDEITQQGRAHAQFTNSLPWVAELAQRLPEPDAVLELAGRFEPADLEQLASALSPETRARVWLLLGRHAYRHGDLERALELLSRVDAASSPYLRARFLQGVVHVRRRHAKPAIAAFREVARLVDEGETDGSAEALRMRELAWLSLGRVYYTAAHAVSGKRSDGALLGNAVEAWSRVGSSSEYWLDALFESGWALFVADEHARALGNLHALLSPYFEGAFYPEAHLLKAVIFFHSCQMDNSLAVLQTFHTQYDPIREQLQALLARDPDGQGSFQLLSKVRAGTLAGSPRFRAVLRLALGDRELLGALAEVDALGDEDQALARAPAALRDSSLGERIRQDILVARSFAQAQAGDLARARAQRLLRELQEVANQADTVEIEILNYKRGKLGTPPNVPSPAGGIVQVDSEHVIWPFNGEYWRDELGYYRQQVSSYCDAR